MFTLKRLLITAALLASAFVLLEIVNCALAAGLDITPR